MYRFLRLVFLGLSLSGATATSAQQIPTLPQSPPGINAQGTMPNKPVGTGSKVDELSDEQIQAFMQKAQASGLSEAQIEQLAQRQGYSSIDIAKMRERISKMQMGTTKKLNEESKPTDLAPAGRKQAEVVTKKMIPTVADSTSTDKKEAEVYGASFFKNPNLTFEPNISRLASPKNYVIGPEDQLVVELSGNSVMRYSLTVTPDGTVSLENTGPISVNGLSIEEARERIWGKLKQLYGMPGIRMQLTLGNIRTIRVTITGEVLKPGTYSVSSLATAFNAIYQSGGPSRYGSFRNIQIRRENKVIRTIDIYNFLLTGDESDNIPLRDQDIIVFPDYVSRVAFEGEVRRPIIFEAKAGENLQDILRYAGGFTDQAYTAHLTVRRYTNRELKMLNVSENDTQNFALKNGDKFTVGAVLERYENKVEIKGAIFRPGIYALDNNLLTVRQLLLRAEGVREDAFMARAFIMRESSSLEPSTVSFDLGKLLRNEIADIPLQRQDVILVKSQNELREKYTVQISGAVGNVGNYEFIENMSVADLVTLAGGLTDAAVSSRIEIARRVKTETLKSADKSVVIFGMDIAQDLSLSALDAQFKLAPFDEVFVRSAPHYEKQQVVTVLGEVYFQGEYPIKNRQERISDLILRAGGAKPNAYLPAAQFKRRGEAVALDIEKILVDPSIPANLLLEDGDELAIPKKDEVVRIKGSVLNPSNVNFYSTQVKDYLSQAGGFTELAIPRRLYVTSPNGKTAQTKRFLIFSTYPKVEPGSTITVPGFDEKRKRTLEPTERAALYSVMGSLLLGITTLAVTLLRQN